MNYDCIIWDWNGTLLDDIGASLASVNDMLARRGKEPIDIDFYRECITTPIRGFYDRVFDMENEDYPALLEEYNNGYCLHLDGCTLAEGAEKALALFKQKGINQVIISSCEKGQLAKYTAEYGITGYFDAILGADGYLADSKIERAKNYLSKKYPGGARVLTVGDLIHDYEMALEAGTDCVLVKTGHSPRELLYGAGCKVIENAGELCEII